MKRHRPRHAASRRASDTRHSSASRRRPGQLRIIGGEYRRRLLPVFDHPGLRPTPDRVRETLYNWLASMTNGARVLDLYAGTGALGLEALSRGAREAWFVESEPRVAQALRDNLTTLGAQGHVITTDAVRFLTREREASPDGSPPGKHTSFDLILLDPPFRQGFAIDACNALETQGWLAADAWVYVETERELELSVPATWRLHREVSAGDSLGRLFHRQVPTPLSAVALASAAALAEPARSS